jgi:integrase/recombinase XerD
MIRHNPENERIKHAYLGVLREALGRDPSALDTVAMALHRFETFTGYLDFRTFDREQAGEFKAYITTVPSARGGSPLSAATIAATLRALKAFFAWLAACRT